MAKDPAFLFYPNDWLGGTMGMSFEEKGAYMDLLMMQFNRGHMTEHMCGQVVGQIWDTIKVKFIQDEKGLWFNERLEIEKEKRKAYGQSRRNNVSGKNQYSKEKKESGHMTKHMTGHMEDVNENRNVSTIENKKDKIEIPECSEQMRKAIDEFMEHRKSKKAPIKTQLQFDKWLKQLAKFSKGTERLSIQIIDKSIANGWTGIFELDETKQSNGKKSLDDCDRELLEGIGMNEHKLID